MHSLADLLHARRLMITTGHEDGNGPDSLRPDPAFQLALGRLPDGATPCSQPTNSRLENLPRPRDLLRMAQTLVGLYCASLWQGPQRITLDIDDTLDAFQDGQRLRLFNAYSDEFPFQPIIVFDREGRPVAALLRLPVEGLECNTVARHRRPGQAAELRQNSWASTGGKFWQRSKDCLRRLGPLAPDPILFYKFFAMTSRGMRQETGSGANGPSRRRLLSWMSRHSPGQELQGVSHGAASWSRDEHILVRNPASCSRAVFREGVNPFTPGISANSVRSLLQNQKTRRPASEISAFANRRTTFPISVAGHQSG